MTGWRIDERGGVAAPDQIHESHRLKLRLLGGFDLRCDGEAVVLQPLGERLVALLALSPRGIHRNFLAFQLWPDKPETRAKANLRSALWRLHKAGFDSVEAYGSRLRLADSVWVDVQQGIDAVVESHASSGQFQPAGLLAAELLPGWYDDWLDIERERLRQLQLAALERHATESLGQGRLGDAIQYGLAAVSIDPLRESPHRIVIDAHIAEGNHSEAQRAFDRYRQHLSCDDRLCASIDLTQRFATVT